MVSKFVTAAAVTALAVASLATAAPSALADSGTPTPAHQVLEAGLSFSGYDAAVAEANGYVIKTNTAGMQYSVKKDASPQEDTAAQQKAAAKWSKVSTRPSAYAEHNDACGKAYLDGNAIGNVSINIRTGFKLLSGDHAVFYYWKVDAVDGGGVTPKPFGPSSLAFRIAWEGNWTHGGLTRGSAYTTISPESYVALADGSYCHPVPLTVYYDIYLGLSDK
ncbi:hypothetical protein [Kitasatospora purpeofusca]|uniref:hypothetical protein n=1 Tax=Kitasatospora purpeofusca TaxID=67352 RepID=UPI003660DA07